MNALTFVKKNFYVNLIIQTCKRVFCALSHIFTLKMRGEILKIRPNMNPNEKYLQEMVFSISFNM